MLSISLLIVAATCFGISSSGFIVPATVWKATIENDSLLILALNDTAVTEYSLDGRTSQRLSLETDNVRLMGGVLDFVSDEQNNIHCLAYTLPEKEIGIIKVNRFTGAHNLIHLNKRVGAFRLDMDPQGNYYLLGFEPELRKSIVEGTARSGTMYLVHKYSSNGQYIASFLPMALPIAKGDFQKIQNSAADRSHFAVLPNGQIFFFQSNADSTTPPWSALGIVYVVDEMGNVTQSKLQAPQGHFLAGIHKHKGEILFEWSPPTAFATKRLEKGDGSLVKTVPEGGRILAISDLLVATVVRKGPDSFLFLVSVK
jgi:hypothetical protein